MVSHDPQPTLLIEFTQTADSTVSWFVPHQNSTENPGAYTNTMKTIK